MSWHNDRRGGNGILTTNSPDNLLRQSRQILWKIRHLRLPNILENSQNRYSLSDYDIITCFAKVISLYYFVKLYYLLLRHKKSIVTEVDYEPTLSYTSGDGDVNTVYFFMSLLWKDGGEKMDLEYRGCVKCGETAEAFRPSTYCGWEGTEEPQAGRGEVHDERG